MKSKTKAELTQFGERVIECIKIEIANDFENDFSHLLIQCVGVNFDMMDREFFEMMLKVRELFKSLILKELNPFIEGNMDTINYMMDMIEFMAERNYPMVDNFKVLRKKVNFYLLNPKVFDDFLEITKDIFAGWDEFLALMLNMKMSIKDELKERLKKREEALQLYFEDPNKKILEPEDAGSLEFVNSQESEKNDLNEFQELEQQNHEQLKDSEEDETSFSSIDSDQEEDSNNASNDSEESESSDISSEEESLKEENSESSIQKDAESNSKEHKTGENKDNHHNEGDSKPKLKERILLDEDEDGKLE